MKRFRKILFAILSIRKNISSPSKRYIILSPILVKCHLRYAPPINHTIFHFHLWPTFSQLPPPSFRIEKSAESKRAQQTRRGGKKVEEKICASFVVPSVGRGRRGREREREEGAQEVAARSLSNFPVGLPRLRRKGERIRSCRERERER